LIFDGSLFRKETTSASAQLEHHPLFSFVIDQEMAMLENAAVFLKVRVHSVAHCRRKNPRGVDLIRRTASGPPTREPAQVAAPRPFCRGVNSRVDILPSHPKAEADQAEWSTRLPALIRPGFSGYILFIRM
jgi:hypothetical protein